jgi:L-2,4-diaminobutyrate transaminase
VASTRTLEELNRAHMIQPTRDYHEQENQDPRIVRGGKGIRVEMSDGTSAIDGFSSLWNVNIGYGRTEIADAVAEQMKQLAYFNPFYDFATEPSIRLAERLVELLPSDRGLTRFLFTSGGSDANETAFHFARQYHAAKGHRGRMKIISRSMGYHGGTRAAESATRIPIYHTMEAPDPLHIEMAAPYRSCVPFSCYQSTDCHLDCVADLERVLAREDPNTVAALIVDAVMGTGGMIPSPEGYFEKLQDTCRKHDILLILDEVVTGFGRTGKWFGMEQGNIKPDLVTMAKGITSGYLPLGGVGMTQNVWETLRDGTPRGLGFLAGLTYNNHPAACAAALANLEIVEREGLVENTAEVGPYLQQCLRDALEDRPYCGEIRGVGFMSAVEWAEPGTNDPVGGRYHVFANILTKKAYEKGLIVRALWESTGIVPPLCTTRQDVDEIVDIVAAAARETTEAVEAKRSRRAAKAS